MGAVTVAVAACTFMLTIQLVTTVLLTLVVLPWKRMRRHDDDDNDGVSRHYPQQQQRWECTSKDWRSTNAQFDDVSETCFPQQRNVTMFDLSSGFAETNV